MADMPKSNGVKAQASAPIVEMMLRWAPQTGEFQMASPQIDDVVKLGMLAMAADLIAENRAKAARGEGPSLIVPAARMS
jgi:hypothetical protein